jgi:hypothetical protein
MTTLADYLGHLTVLKNKARLLDLEYSAPVAEDLAAALDNSLQCISEPAEVILSPPQRKAIRELHDRCVQLQAAVRNVAATGSAMHQNDVVRLVRHFLDVIDRCRALLS